MRRSIVLATVLAASTAIFGACEPKANAPENKPPTTTTPAPASSPAASPAASPVNGVNGTPKTNASPEAKKPETKDTNVKKDEVKKDEKPAANK